MLHIDLFSGIGGFSLACEWAGIETILFCENDKFCQRVLKKHWPSVPIVEDVNDKEEIKRIVTDTQNLLGYGCNNNTGISTQRETLSEPRNSDRQSVTPNSKSRKSWQQTEQERRENISGRDSILLTAGFPCQPFSGAGKRKGSSDDRYLWPQTLSVIESIRPDAVILENVAGLLSMVFPDNETNVANQASLFGNQDEEIAEYNTICGRIDSDLRQAGYEVVWLVIPACSLSAPHRRDRVWIVGYSIGGGCERESRQRSGKKLKDGLMEPETRTPTNSDNGQGRPRTITKPYGTPQLECFSNDSGYRPSTDTSLQGLQGAYNNEESPKRLHIFSTERIEQVDTNTSSEGLSQHEYTRTPSERESCRPVTKFPDITPDTNNATTTRYGQDSRGIHGKPESEGLNNSDWIIPDWRENWYEVAARVCGIFNGLSAWIYRNGGLSDYAETRNKITRQDLPHLWEGFQSESFQWSIGRFNTIQEKETLFTVLWQFFTESNEQDCLPFESAEVQEAYLRNVWHYSEPECSPQRWEYQEQYAREYSDSLSQLSYEVALATKELSYRYSKNRVDRLKSLGNAIVPQVAYQIIKAIQEAQ